MIRVDPSDVPCASRLSILPKINRPGTMISPPPTPTPVPTPVPENGADVALGATSAPFFGRDGSSPAETVAKRGPLVGDDRVDGGVAQMARLTGGGRRAVTAKDALEG